MLPRVNPVLLKLNVLGILNSVSSLEGLRGEGFSNKLPGLVEAPTLGALRG